MGWFNNLLNKVYYSGCRSTTIATSGIESELSKANKLKEKELKQQKELKEREEWLLMLSRMTDDSLLYKLRLEKKYITYMPAISGGLGNASIMEFPEESELNPIYVDIENECKLRGLI